MTKVHLLWLVLVGIVLLPLISLDSHQRITALLVILGIPLGIYVLAPIAVLATGRYPVPQWDVPDMSELDGLPWEDRTFFEATDLRLSEIGFSLVAVVKRQNLAPGFTTWVTLYVKRSERTRAAAHAWVRDDPAVPAAVRPTPSFYFNTYFVDGRMVETANSRHDHPFPPVEARDYRQFPEALDARLLYEIHRLRCAPLGNAPRDFPAPGAEVEYFTGKWADTHRVHVGTGYLWEAEPERMFRPTLKGAYLMTWRLLPPINWINRWRKKRNNRAFLAEHNLLHWQPAAVPDDKVGLAERGPL